MPRHIITKLQKEEGWSGKQVREKRKGRRILKRRRDRLRGETQGERRRKNEKL